MLPLIELRWGNLVSATHLADRLARFPRFVEDLQLLFGGPLAPTVGVILHPPSHRVYLRSLRPGRVKPSHNFRRRVSHFETGNTLLIRYHAGDSRIWSVLRVPTVEQEDRRHLHQELRTLKKERLRVTNRIQGLLASQGIWLPKIRDLSAARPDAVVGWFNPKLVEGARACTRVAQQRPTPRRGAFPKGLLEFAAGRTSDEVPGTVWPVRIEGRSGLHAPTHGTGRQRFAVKVKNRSTGPSEGLDSRAFIEGCLQREVLHANMLFLQADHT